MKKKILLTLLCAITIGFSTTNSVSATTSYTNEGGNNGSEVVDITDNPNFVVEKGQISLKNIELKVSNNRLVVNPKVYNYSTTTQVDLLKDEISESIKFENMLIDAITTGKNITDIGYTEVVVKRNESNNWVPVTKEEYSRAQSLRSIIGPTQSFGKLKLQTFVDTGVSNGERYTMAYSDAIWTGLDDGNDSPDAGEDLLSITVPSRYTVLNNYFWGTYKNPSGIPSGDVAARVTNNNERNLVYAFEEFKKPQSEQPGSVSPARYADSVRVGARAKTSNLTPATNKYVSHYVHTYSNITISPTISITGEVSFAIGGSDKAWQISSSVVTEF